MKSIFLVTLMIAGAGVNVRAQTPGNLVFRGTVTGPWQGYKVVLYNNVEKVNETAVIENGKFSFTRPFTGPNTYYFYSTYDTQVKHGYRPFGVLVDGPCEVNIEVEITKGFIESKVSGSPQMELYQRYQAQAAEAEKRISDRMAEKYGKPFLTAKDERYAEWDNDRTMMQGEALAPILSKFIAAHPADFASAYVLRHAPQSLPADKVDEMFRLLSPSLKDIDEVKYVASHIAGARKSLPGNTVDNFTLKDAEGQPHNLSDFKGKYVLLDLWASWCGPCRAEFPDLRQTYAAFHHRNFEIFGISIDTDAGRWRKALDAEKLPWPQTIDEIGDKAIHVKQFAATTIPRSLLLDPNGVIVAVDLKGDALRKKLEELLH